MIDLFFKTLFRNNIPLFYFLMSIISAFFCCGVIFYYFTKALEEPSFIFFILMVFALDPLSLSYYLFSFSYDYNILVNIKNNDQQIRKYIINKIFFYFIFILFFNLFFISASYITGKFNFNQILYADLVIFSVVPINILLSILFFQKINLFENRFLILTQKLNGYLLVIIQVIFSIVVCSFGYKYLLLLSILILILFIIYFNKIISFFKNKITNEYLGNRKS